MSGMALARGSFITYAICGFLVIMVMRMLAEMAVATETGNEWHDAVDNIAWESGDLLLLGSSAAGPRAQVCLGTSAAKILRHAPVPVMILPRRHTAP